MALGAQLVIGMRGARLSIRELGKWFKPRLRISDRFWIMCLREKEGWHGDGGHKKWGAGRRKTSRKESGLSSFPHYIRKCVWVELFLRIKLNCSRDALRVRDVKLDTVFAKQCVTERNEPKMCRTKYPTIQEQIIFMHIVGAVRGFFFHSSTFHLPNHNYIFVSFLYSS